MSAVIENTIPAFDSYSYEEGARPEAPDYFFRISQTLLDAMGVALVASAAFDLRKNRKGLAITKIAMCRASHHLGEKIGRQSEKTNNPAIILGRTASLAASGLLAKEGVLSKRSAAMFMGADVSSGFNDFLAFNRRRVIDTTERQENEILRSAAFVATAIAGENIPLISASLDAINGLIVRQALSISRDETHQLEPVKYSGPSPRPLR